MKITLPMLFLLLFPLLVQSQVTPGEADFDYVVSEATGDLNNDGIEDLVVVSQDTLADTAPFLLEIFFSQAEGSRKKILSTKTAISPQFPDGRNGFQSGAGFWEVVIKDGILIIKNELLRGHFNHRFRFQNGKFVLVGFSSVSADGRGRMYRTNYNLLTGILEKKVENYQTDEVLDQSSKVIKASTLPSLKSFVPDNHSFF